MKRLLSFIVALSIVNFVKGQALSPDDVPQVERRLWKIGFVLPGIEYERSLGSFTSINVNPHLNVGYSSNFALGNAWLVQPAIDVQLRKYYNLLKRAAKEKNTTGNSANFVALNIFRVSRSIVDTEDFRNHHYYGLGPIWGIQRTYRSNFNLSFQAGIAYAVDSFGREDYLVLLKVRLGLALRRDH